MNKQTAKNYVIGSIAATMFIGFGFGMAVASSPLAVSTPFDGLVISVIGLVVMFILLKKVEIAGYRLKVVTKEEKDE